MFDAHLPIEALPSEIDLRRVDLTCNMRRFYRMSVQRDLFGGACLVREWGRIGTRGQALTEQHPDERCAITSLVRLAAQKQRRGYLA